MSEFGLFLTVTSTRTVFCHLHLNFIWFVDYRNDKTECLVSTGVHVWIRRYFIKQIITLLLWLNLLAFLCVMDILMKYGNIIHETLFLTQICRLR